MTEALYEHGGFFRFFHATEPLGHHILLHGLDDFEAEPSCENGLFYFRRPKPFDRTISCVIDRIVSTHTGNLISRAVGAGWNGLSVDLCDAPAVMTGGRNDLVSCQVIRGGIMHQGCRD